MDNTYNGWTNYATWRINLEVFDGMSIEDFNDDIIRYDINDPDDAKELEAERDNIIDNVSEGLEEFVTELMEQQGSGLALDYAMAFVNDVNWNEIATSMYNDYIDELKEQ